MGKVKESRIDNDYQLTAMYGIEATSTSKKMVLCKSQPLLSLPRTNLSLMTLKLFDIYLARINPKDPTLTKVVFTKQELCKVLGVNKINNNELKASLKALMTCIVTIETRDKKQSSTILTGLLSNASITYSDKYYGNIATVELKCTEEAKKYIYNVDAVGYLKLNLSMVLSFEGRNAYALFQYLTQNKFRGHWEVNINELKEYLGVSDKYKDIKDFERRVLKPCQKEIQENTEMEFEYTKIRVGRSIQKIGFQIIKTQELEPESGVFDDDCIPFAKDSERIELGHYKYDDDELPEYTAEDYNNDDFINQFRPDKRPRRRW